MNSKEIARNTFLEFAEKEGNGHICTENALVGILDVINQKRPKSIIEYGIGIGCMTLGIFKGYEALGKLNDLLYFGTEDNDFCKEHFALNLGEYAKLPNFNHKENLDFKVETLFDLVIVDGPANAANAMKMLAERGVIFIEGYRENQIAQLSNSSEKREFIFYRQYTTKKHRPYGPFEDGIQKGYTVIQFEPTLGEKIDFFIKKVQNHLIFRYLKFVK